MNQSKIENKIAGHSRKASRYELNASLKNSSNVDSTKFISKHSHTASIYKNVNEES